MKFLILLVITWVINGGIKFLCNFIQNGKKAFKLIGYGGFPSTHTAIVTSMLIYAGLSYGWDNPAVAAMLVLLWVVANDARSLRNAVGKHSSHLNKLDSSQNHRERIGHSIVQIIGGAVVGALIGFGFYIITAKYPYF